MDCERDDIIHFFSPIYVKRKLHHTGLAMLCGTKCRVVKSKQEYKLCCKEEDATWDEWHYKTR